MGLMDSFDEIKSSALKELANIGISHVATAIGEIARERISISVPEFNTFTKKEFVNTKLQQQVGAYFTVEGISELTETIILFQKQDAYELMNKFVNTYQDTAIDSTKLSSDEKESIFLEITTVISAAYFSAVDAMFNLKTNCGIPVINFENGQLHDFICKRMRNDEAVSIKASFVAEHSKIKGEVFLIPDLNTINMFFNAIGVT
ncbi:MAG: chemotaxis protein CheC [Candidatus Omnitrophica bacterium]|nr:chemotaxis protein CheC [Candidatus Omnitrophota bacterium]